MVSASLRHTVGILAVIVLAGSPAAAAVCELACAESSGAVHSHGHATAEHEHQPASGAHSHGAHHDHASADAAEAAAVAPVADVTPAIGRTCCDRAAAEPAALPPGREDSRLTQAPPAMIAITSGLTHPPTPAGTPPHRGPPSPGRSSTTPFPLRI